MSWTNSIQTGGDVSEFYRLQYFCVYIRRNERSIRLRIDLHETPLKDGSIDYMAYTQFDDESVTPESGDVVWGHGNTEAEAITKSFGAFMVYGPRLDRAFGTDGKRKKA